MGKKETAEFFNPADYGLPDSWPNIEKACDLATMAVEEDYNRNYRKAVQLYDSSIAYFIRAINNEAKNDDEMKDAATKKYKEYQSRSEELHAYLLRKNKKSDNKT